MRRFAFVFLFIFLFSSFAYAWGPGTHLELSAYLFSNLFLLAPSLGRLLKKHAYSFFYGAVFADSIVGKKFARQMNRCHSWGMGQRLLSEADSQAQKAFAYGFLTHLSADVVAHNFFVPRQIIASYRANALGHFYWEMRFEQYLDNRVWDIANQFAKSPVEEYDELMEKILVSMLLPFRASKRLFERLVIVQSIGRWRKLVNRMSERSPFPFSSDDFRYYLSLSVDAAIDFLTSGEKSWAVSLDPLGIEAIRAAQSIKRGLKKLNRFNAIDNGFVSSLFEKLKAPKLRHGDLVKPRLDVIIKQLGFK